MTISSSPSRARHLLVAALTACGVLFFSSCGESVPPEIEKAQSLLDEALAGGGDLKLLVTGLMGDHPNLEVARTTITDALQNGSNDVRNQALDVISDWDGAAMAEQVAPLVGADDEFLRRKASRLLASWGVDAGKDVLLGARRDSSGLLDVATCERLAAIGDLTCESEAIEDLKNKDSSIRAAAAATLGELGGESALTALRSAVSRQRGVNRSPMIEALGAIGDESDVARVNQYARYRENVLSVIRAMGDLGGEDAESSLRGYLASNDPLARLEAAGALVGAGITDQEVLDAIRSSMEDERFRYLAAQLLTPSVNDGTDAILGELAADGDMRVQAQALQALVGRDGDVVMQAAKTAWTTHKEAEILEGPNPPMDALLVAVRGSGPVADEVLVDAIESVNWAYAIRGALGVLEHRARAPQ